MLLYFEFLGKKSKQATNMDDMETKQQSTSKKIKTSSGSSFLPNGVVDLYPLSTTTFDHGITGWQMYHMSDINTNQYIRVYGKDFWDNLHKTEVPVFPVSLLDIKQSHVRAPWINYDGEENYTDKVIHSDEEDDISTCSENTPRDGYSYYNHRGDENIRKGGVLSFPRNGHEEYLNAIGQPELTQHMRCRLVAWMIDLSEQNKEMMHFQQSTLHLAITLMDRVLACGPFSEQKSVMPKQPCQNSRIVSSVSGAVSESEDDDEEDDQSNNTFCYNIPVTEFQLLGATCVWMACKLLETVPPNLDLMQYVSGLKYSDNQFIIMEQRVGNALKFRFFAYPTPQQFLLEFLRASYEGDTCGSFNHGYNISYIIKGGTLFTEMANYLLDIGRLAMAPVCKKPSLLAASAVYLARVTLGVRTSLIDTAIDPCGYWTPTLQYYSGYKKQELRETVQTIHLYHHEISSEMRQDLSLVYDKYKTRKHHRVALKTIASIDDMGFESIGQN